MVRFVRVSVHAVLGVSAALQPLPSQQDQHTRHVRLSVSTTDRVVPSGVLDSETMISGCKADVITPWTSWTLAVRKYDAKVILCCFNSRDGQNNMDLCSCSDKAIGFL
ncbi:uncharacterized protein HD556DRAFT_1308278 [Suillus plorans]|uniref:Secreted protein n=1 Tax=Suillus plorans TaxID=116603 RepID=A0A9P7AQR7_9AGAM|nr:uncharacterized protein HD556DRAFT_1308278 [Suillus plorans]KAG1794227.1 hypothetical protein HD556DRAFT_1308278 [Suillus plorans]